jgi:hypothetical protein
MNLHIIVPILLIAGPYYPLGTIGTVPRAYDIFRAYEKMEGEQIKSSSSVALQSEVNLGRLLDTSPFVPISGCHPPIPTS